MPELIKGIDIVDKADDAGEINIYGYIADVKWFDEEVTPTEVKNTLAALKNKKKVVVNINSGGGGVWAGTAIHSILSRLEAETIGIVDGICASIASVILQACKRRIVANGSMVMIHNPLAPEYGDATAMRKTADLLDKVKGNIIDIYRNRTTKNVGAVSAMMDAETWMSAAEAVENGFADEVEGSKVVNLVMDGRRVVVNGYEFDTSVYKSFPKNTIAKPEPVQLSLDIPPAKPEIVNFSELEKKIYHLESKGVIYGLQKDCQGA